MGGKAPRLEESPCYLQSSNQARHYSPLEERSFKQIDTFLKVIFHWNGILLEMDSVMTLNECHPADWIGAVFCLPSVNTAELPEASAVR